jgi:hypothetical protein
MLCQTMEDLMVATLAHFLFLMGLQMYVEDVLKYASIV